MRPDICIYVGDAALLDPQGELGAAPAPDNVLVVLRSAVPAPRRAMRGRGGDADRSYAAAATTEHHWW